MAASVVKETPQAGAHRAIMAYRKKKQSEEKKNQAEPKLASFVKTQPPTPISDPKPPKTPRNALCPCGSGEKFKRCCGKGAPPVLHPVA
jgi:uncharacterized protein YchJ